MITIILNINCEKSINNDGDFSVEEVSFIESDDNIINPERGFYVFHETSTRNSNILDHSFLESQRNEGISLIYTAYTMPDFRNSPISEEFLNRIILNMKALRSGGCKAIVRFRYTNNQEDTPWDAPEEILHHHIAQLTPIFQEYSDVIAVLEAGFIGVWGEWYYTENYVFRATQEEYDPRRKVLNALLDALPKDRMVLLRYPAAKLFSFNITYNDTISEQTAHNQSDISRVGFHNDCFLADQDDRGTFGGNRNYRRYWEWESKYVPMGGETCAPSSYSECSNALIDMAKYHWSFLNMSYHPGVISDWRTNNCMKEIQQRLGYRFVLTSGIITNNLKIGDTCKVMLEIKNKGFAAPYNPRDVNFVVVDKENQSILKIIKLKEDPRFWLPDKLNKINIEFMITDKMRGKELDLFLHMPDPNENINEDPRFSIRLANNEIWDADTGFNKIYSIKIH